MIEIRLEIPKLDEVFADLERGFSEFIGETAKGIRSRTEANLEKSGHSGRRYRKKSGRIHTASAPGESPARDTGKLWGSVSQVKRDGLTAEFEIPAPYGNYLEFEMEQPRPFLMPAIDETLETRLTEI